MRRAIVLLLLVTPGLLGWSAPAPGELTARVASAPGPEACFSQTGKCVRGLFLAYWTENGAIERQGYPITDEFDETDPATGQTRRVQYFERARFEYHPEFANTPSAVLLGLIGAQQFAGKYPQGQPAARTEPAINVWAATMGAISPALAELPPRVYVPDELRGDITVIDPRTFQVIDRYPSGTTAHHVGPGPDFSKLYVNNMGSNNLLEIDARSGKPIRTIFASVPYNLYFTTDGAKAIVAAEPNNRLDFYDPISWQLIKSVPMGCSGVDHLDMSADGRYLLVSCEFDGQVVKVDTVRMEVIGRVNLGGLPVDVKLSPDGAVFYVANQGRHGVSVVDPIAMREIAFLPTGQGAHGMAISRDTKGLYVVNRLAGTISTIDFATGQVAATWFIGGSPDMVQVSPDGSQLWTSGRYHGVVYVVDTGSGQLIQTIRTGTAPHGLSYFPQPGRISIGHNGVYR